MTDHITPGERRELRAVVRQQMRVLRTEVEQRKYELIAEAERRLAEKYRDEDIAADELQHRLARLTENTNRQLLEVLREYETLIDGRWKQRMSGYATPHIYRSNTGSRDQLRKALVAGIDVQVKQAKLGLDRQEADLLKDLAVDALETSAAREFLTRIPTVAELVPSQRLREIEAAFDAKDASS
jgi:hypothetical protein